MKTTKLTLVLVALFLAPLVAFGADAVVAAPSNAEALNWLNLLIAGLTPMVIAVIKWLAPKVPGWSLPIAAPVVGLGVDWVLRQAGVATSGGWQPLVWGALGVWARELQDQLRALTPFATKIAAIVVLAATLCLSTGCKTAGVYDPVKTSDVKNAVQVPMQEAIMRIVRNSPEHSAQIATYFRAVGTVFCKMRDTGTFDADFVIAEVDRATAGLQSGLDPLVLTIKNTSLILYSVFWGQRAHAELPPDQFMWNVSDLFCNAINTGLADADAIHLRFLKSRPAFQRAPARSQ